MTGIFAEPPDAYLKIPLLDGEQVLRRQTAGYESLWGGELVITNQRVLFRP